MNGPRTGSLSGWWYSCWEPVSQRCRFTSANTNTLRTNHLSSWWLSCSHGNGSLCLLNGSGPTCASQQVRQFSSLQEIKAKKSWKWCADAPDSYLNRSAFRMVSWSFISFMSLCTQGLCLCSWGSEFLNGWDLSCLGLNRKVQKVV